MRIEHMIVATDLDERSRWLSGWSAELARQAGARVTLVHADRLMAVGVHGSGELGELLELQALLRGRLEEEVGFLAERGIACEGRLEVGEPAEALLRVASEEQADVVVLGRRSASRLDRLLMGSTTRRLLRRADVPVLMVGAEAPPGWRQLVATTDESQDSALGVEEARELAQQLGAALEVVHIFEWPLYVPQAPGLPSSSLAPPTLEDLRGYYAREMEAAFERGGRGRWSVVVDSDVAHGVLDFTARHRGELIVIPTHGKGAVEVAVVGSTSEKIAETAEVAVLALPRGWLQRRREG